MDALRNSKYDEKIRYRHLLRRAGRLIKTFTPSRFTDAHLLAGEHRLIVIEFQPLAVVPRVRGLPMTTIHAPAARLSLAYSVGAASYVTVLSAAARRMVYSDGPSRILLASPAAWRELTCAILSKNHGCIVVFSISRITCVILFTRRPFAFH